MRRWRWSDTAHRRLGIVLGRLLDAFGKLPATEQINQLQRRIQARCDTGAGQAIAIMDEAGIPWGHDHVGEALRKAGQKLPVGCRLIAVEQS